MDPRKIEPDSDYPWIGWVLLFAAFVACVLCGALIYALKV